MSPWRRPLLIVRTNIVVVDDENEVIIEKMKSIKQRPPCVPQEVPAPCFAAKVDLGIQLDRRTAGFLPMCLDKI